METNLAPDLIFETELDPSNDIAASPRGLPPWGLAELPAPPPFSLRNALYMIGPGAILLGTSIGSGEWLIGPAVTAKFGGTLLWVATVSIFFQAILNVEFFRYTMYTGEPIFTGFMRTRPGSTFWAVIYSFLAFLQLGWPAWAFASATAIAAAILGRLPNDGDASLVQYFGIGCFLTCIAIVLSGRRIERTLELAQWFFILAILGFLIVLGTAFTSADTWSTVTRGFISFGSVPPGVDWALLGAFAAYAGAGGLINATLSNWARDKGFGMGSTVGFIPALVGGKAVPLSPVGRTFEINPKNMSRWRAWWKYVALDQYGLWALGCLIGMGLPALLTIQFIPQGTVLEGFGVAAYQAEYLSRIWGPAMWFVTLLIGFWILFSTQLGITDCFVRLVTDIVWAGSPRARIICRNDIRSIYYTILAVFTVWGVAIMLSGVKPMYLILLGANIAGLNFVLLGLHTLYVNTTLLPQEIRPGNFRRILILCSVIFFGFFFCSSLPALFQKLIGG